MFGKKKREEQAAAERARLNEEFEARDQQPSYDIEPWQDNPYQTDTRVFLESEIIYDDDDAPYGESTEPYAQPYDQPYGEPYSQPTDAYSEPTLEEEPLLELEEEPLLEEELEEEPLLEETVADEDELLLEEAPLEEESFAEDGSAAGFETQEQPSAEEDSFVLDDSELVEEEPYEQGVNYGDEQEFVEERHTVEPPKREEPEPEVVYQVEPVEEDEFVKPAKLVKLPSLVDYMLSMNLSKTVKMKFATMLLGQYNKYKYVEEEKKILVDCLKKIILDLQR